MPLNIGITGGIGSGKSTVAKIFEVLGIPVYYADDRAKKLMTQNKKVKAKLKTLLGPECYFRNGRLNRKYIAEKIFSNDHLRKEVNGIVHPAVFEDAVAWFQSHSSYPYLLQEAALLVENGRHQMLDGLIVVTAPEEVRIQRVTQRDRKSKKAVQDIIAKQTTDEEKLKVADHVIVNDGTISLVKQVMGVHSLLLMKSKKV